MGDLDRHFVGKSYTLSYFLIENNCENSMDIRTQSLLLESNKRYFNISDYTARNICIEKS